MTRHMVCTVVSAIMATVGWSQSLTWLDTRFNPFTIPLGVSADGSVVVGMVESFPQQSRAFRWTRAFGTQYLGTLGGSESVAYGVSANGSIVIGWAHNTNGERRAFHWTAATGMVDLGALGGNQSEARGLSADGSVVVGWAHNGAGERRAFRWTAATGMIDLGTLGGAESEAWAVSADGSVIAGIAQDATGEWRGFRWTAQTGMIALGARPFSPDGSLDVSADGSVIVGTSRRAISPAFRWTEATGMTDLPLPSGASVSFAYGVSGDGNIVVGGVDLMARAFRWRSSGEMDDLNSTYANLIGGGATLWQAMDVSPDGRYIVGVGMRGVYEAFLLDTGFPRRGDVDRNGCVDNADLLRVLFHFGERGYRNEDLNWDGIVDDADLLEVLFNFGSGC
jgi:probable HAF family extracellular repeat protein